LNGRIIGSYFSYFLKLAADLFLGKITVNGSIVCMNVNIDFKLLKILFQGKSRDNVGIHIS